METITKVGMREFRAHLPQYLQASAPIAVTRQGETIGYYMPTRPMPEQIERDALKVAALRLESMLLAQEVDEEELVSEFRRLREKDRD